MTGELQIPNSGPGPGRAEPDDAAVAPPPESLFRRVQRLLHGRLRWVIPLAIALGAGLGVVGWRIGQKTFISRAQVFVAPYSDN